jgi:hypothetical protein
MEIVLGSLIDWIHKRLAARRVLKWILIGLVFSIGCWLAYIEWTA